MASRVCRQGGWPPLSARFIPSAVEEPGKVAFEPAEKGQRDTGVTAGGFHQSITGFQLAAFFRFPDAEQHLPILDGTGIEAFKPGHDPGGTILEQALEREQRGLCHQLTEIVMNHRSWR